MHSTCGIALKNVSNVAVQVADIEDILAPDYLMAPIFWRLKLEKYRIILPFFRKLKWMI
jgi:hypothetical protein